MSNALTGFNDELLKIAQKDQRIVVLSADLTDSLRLTEFKKQLPKQFVDLGVAEQNLAGVAAGLALAGKLPYIYSFAIFSPGINWLMIRNICYSNLPVRIVGGLPGFDTTHNGATHQMLEDIALMRVLPNMSIISPADANQALQTAQVTLTHPGPIYFRMARTEVLTVSPSDPGSFVLGKAQLLSQGDDVTLISTGSMLIQTLEATKMLAEKNIQARVLNLHTIKPLDKVAILDAFTQTKAVVSVEDHQLAGGLGSAIAEQIAQTARRTTPFKIIAVNDKFGETGSLEELQQKHGLTADNIVKTVLETLP